MKQWMVATLFLFVALTTLCFHFTDMLYRSVLEPPSQQPAQRAAALDSALLAATSDPGHWRDPAWQTGWRDTLDALDVRGLIRDPAGVRSSASVPSGTTSRRARRCWSWRAGSRSAR